MGRGVRHEVPGRLAATPHRGEGPRPRRAAGLSDESRRSGGPTTIARIYKDRWQIELFFKALKQNLRVKTFVGTSRNALHIQIWTALIALLAAEVSATARRPLAGRSRILVALLRMNLFVYRDLWAWLHDPFTAPPPLPEPVQGTLALA